MAMSTFPWATKRGMSDAGRKTLQMEIRDDGDKIVGNIQCYIMVLYKAYIETMGSCEFDIGA
jgi:hypothetical protein